MGPESPDVCLRSIMLAQIVVATFFLQLIYYLYLCYVVFILFLSIVTDQSNELEIGGHMN